MRVSLIGATGNAGSRILAELAQRGHQVTAIVRHPERVPLLDGVIAKECDANRVDDLASMLRGQDVVVSSVHFLDGQADKLTRTTPLRWSTRSNSRAIPGADSQLATDAVRSHERTLTCDAPDTLSTRVVI
jgi:putative NADH-flavin reductase